MREILLHWCFVILAPVLVGVRSEPSSMVSPTAKSSGLILFNELFVFFKVGALVSSERSLKLWLYFCFKATKWTVWKTYTSNESQHQTSQIWHEQKQVNKLKKVDYLPSRSQSYTSTLIVLLEEAQNTDLLSFFPL